MTNKDTILEDLVETANKGYKAIDELRAKYADRLEITSKGIMGNYIDLSSLVSNAGSEKRHLRIKRLKFDEFYVGPKYGAWLVKLEGDRLHIGCKNFNASKLLARLKAHVASDLYDPTKCGEAPLDRIEATRLGVKFHLTNASKETHLLPWDDCDKIIEALEKAGIK